MSQQRIACCCNQLFTQYLFLVLVSAMMTESVQKYFPGLTTRQVGQFNQFQHLFKFWNDQVNLVSRADINNLEVRHILHSLAIARVCQFAAGTQVVDIGTGGGFPGIPLAIVFPETNFHLIDSIGKKAKVVETMAKDLGLLNVTVDQQRAEELTGPYDFAVARAVTKTKRLVEWADPIIGQRSINDLPNGLLLLKGGDLQRELQQVEKIYYAFPVEEFFHEPFFAFKQVIYIAL